MTLFANIKEYRIEKGWTQGELAKFAGVSIETIKRYENGKTNPTNDNLSKIASALGIKVKNLYDNVSLSESPNMSPSDNNLSPSPSNLKPQNKSNDKMSNGLSISVHKSSPNMSISPEKSEKLQKMQALIEEQENKLINLRFFSNVSAAAGYGANNDNESFKNIAVTASFLTTILRIPAKQYDVINVLGNSMEPFLKDGDMVLVLPTHEASNGEIVIANLGGDLYVKKLLKDPIKKRIRLTSMNELYEDIVVEDDELDQLKIVGVVKKVLPSGAISI